jgi:predicted acetyltransferase
VPELTLPTVRVRDAYLRGEREMCAEDGVSADYLDVAAADFASFVAPRRLVREMWSVPTTELWYVDGTDYIGVMLVRHHLTPALAEAGGNLGYHVVPSRRRQGHARAMVRAVLPVCRRLGLTEVLVTIEPDNAASRRAVEANGATLLGMRGGQVHYRLSCVHT